MSANEKKIHLRALLLITTPKLSKKAEAVFSEIGIPIQYQWNAVGTAPNEMIDILGLGSPDKSVLVSVLPKAFADTMLKKLKKELRLGTVNSGIAFTLHLSGANNMILHALEKFEIEDDTAQRKDDHTMADAKYTLVTAIINQGFSEEVMDVVREAGAGGGTIVHGRRISSKDTADFWGMSIQEEKEMLFIVTEKEKKMAIMQAISQKFGMHSDAKGIILSLPIDSVIGINED